MKSYEVTVTPKVVTYAGSSSYGEYVVEVYAKCSRDAVTKVRRERNENEGRYGVRASYSAKQVSE